MKSTKHCTKCGTEKALEDFRRYSRNKDGRYSHCKACVSEYNKQNSKAIKAYMREYYQANKESLAEDYVKYYRENKERINAYTRKYHREKRANNMEGCILARCKYRSKRLGIPFNLDLEDIQIPKVCPVLGIPIAYSDLGQKGGTPNSPSIDRIHPELGYVKGNVRIISNRANTLKCDATVAELEAVLTDLRRLNPYPSGSQLARDDGRPSRSLHPQEP